MRPFAVVGAALETHATAGQETGGTLPLLKPVSIYWRFRGMNAPAPSQIAHET
jgi:hypothetical protein